MVFARYCTILALAAACGATPLMTYDLAGSAAKSGVPGAVVAWQTQVSNLSQYFILISSVQSSFQPGPLGVAATNPAFTDTLSPLGTVIDPFGIATLPDLGALTIALTATGSEFGQIFINYMFFDDNPLLALGANQVFPAGMTGRLWTAPTQELGICRGSGRDQRSCQSGASESEAGDGEGSRAIPFRSEAISGSWLIAEDSARSPLNRPALAQQDSLIETR